MVDHTIVHFEIPAKDVEMMRKFYLELFGWKIYRVPGPIEYWMIETVPVNEEGITLRPEVMVECARKINPNSNPSIISWLKPLTNTSRKLKTLGEK